MWSRAAVSVPHLPEKNQTQTQSHLTHENTLETYLKSEEEKKKKKKNAQANPN